MEELVNGGRRRFMLQANYRMGSLLDGCRGWKVPRLAAVVFHQFPHGSSRIHPVMNPWSVWEEREGAAKRLVSFHLKALEAQIILNERWCCLQGARFLPITDCTDSQIYITEVIQKQHLNVTIRPFCHHLAVLLFQHLGLFWFFLVSKAVPSKVPLKAKKVIFSQARKPKLWCKPADTPSFTPATKSDR